MVVAVGLLAEMLLANSLAQHASTAIVLRLDIEASLDFGGLISL